MGEDFLGSEAAESEFPERKEGRMDYFLLRN